MKAIVIENGCGPDGLRVVERPIPEPRRGEVVIRTRAASLNYRDLEIVEGRYHARFAAPFVPLSDGVGEIVATGEDVTRVRVGDRVAGTFWRNWISGPFESADPNGQLGGPLDGMLSEYVRLDAEGVTRVPGRLSDVEAATLPCAGVTAWTALMTEGRLKPGDAVLIQGTGGVSLFGLQFAVAAGGRAIVLSRSDAKLERARALGAAGTVNSREHPDWAEVVLNLTDGLGVDHVLDVGGPGTFTQSLRAIRPGGQINIIGYLGGAEGAINPLDIFRRRALARGISVGPRTSFEAMNRAIDTAALKPVVDSVFPWTDASQAFRRLASGEHFGKIVLAF